MKRIILFISMSVLAGCASTGHVKASRPGAIPKNEYVKEMQGSRVYAAIKSQLQRGTTVNVMVEYQSSFDGLPQGYAPADFGCEADPETVVETEKIFLLDSFSKYPNFNVIDRSRMDASLNESKLGMSGVTATTIQPGSMSGASHLIVIEGKNHFVHINGKNKTRYAEIKKLLDMQRNVVVAMDKLSEEREVRLIGPRPSRVNAPAQEEPQEQNTSLEQLPPIIKATSAQWPAETIKITGDHNPSRQQQTNYSLQSVQSQNSETGEVISESVPVQYQTVNVSQRYVQVRKIPEWQMERIVKQRYPQMKAQDEKAVMASFVKKHPEYRERIMPTVPPHVKTDNP